MTLPIGSSFRNSEIVDLYLLRPPYPERLYELLVRFAPSHARLLDLGCGHGKIARPLTPHFENITAIDPSKKMIELGKTLQHGNASNLNWIESTAEKAELSGSYDVIVAALSIHWMDHALLFPKLLKHTQPNHLFAAIEGDAPHKPPWESDWTTFLTKWVPEVTGMPFDQSSKNDFWTKYLQFVDVADEFELISEPMHQSIDDFILCQHSRDTFAISKLGDKRARFDAELKELLGGHADHNAQLTFRSCTRLTTGSIANQ